jgi:hypothetical protein
VTAGFVIGAYHRLFEIKSFRMSKHDLQAQAQDVDCSFGGEQGGGERFFEPGGILASPGYVNRENQRHAPDSKG